MILAILLAAEPSRSADTANGNDVPASDNGVPASDSSGDRLWVISTRHLCGGTYRADLETPSLRIHRLDVRGRLVRSGVEEYAASRGPARPVVIYVHGNRIDSTEAIARGLFVYRQVARSCYPQGPVDWVIWSWPSEQRGILLGDARQKARRTNVEGLYLGWLLRMHTASRQPTTLIGYSFGARIVSGGLHSLAGGALSGRALPGEAAEGAGFSAGMIAPALENDWLSQRGYHRLATRNLEQLTVLYNRRDAVLRNYWRIDRIRNADALGYTGPTSFAPRFDGSRLPVRSRDCGAVVGFHHDELTYYDRSCGAGAEMARVLKVAASTIPALDEEAVAAE